MLVTGDHSVTNLDEDIGLVAGETGHDCIQNPSLTIGSVELAAPPFGLR